MTKSAWLHPAASAQKLSSRKKKAAEDEKRGEINGTAQLSSIAFSAFLGVITDHSISLL